jgi:hypothetical protein
MFENGEKDGFGRLISCNGTYYVGYFKDDMFDGYGELSCCNLSMRELEYR